MSEVAPAAGLDGGISLSFRAKLATLVAEHAPLVGIVAIYAASATVSRTVLGVDTLVDRIGFPQRLVWISIAWALFFVTAFALRKALVDRSTGGITSGATWMEFRDRYLTLNRLGGFLVILGAYAVMSSTFSGYKRAIPDINPFSWDTELMQLDRTLHFGIDPWRLIHPVVGNPLITRFLDAAYAIWLLVFVVVVIWQAWSTRRFLRAQFLVSFSLSWILLGTILATVFASAGPCFYAVTGSAGPYEPLMAYLADVHDTFYLAAVYTQINMWAGYLDGSYAVPMSAMPSLHVAISVLMALVAWRTHRSLGIAFALYGGLIVVGSVHLGWHYAVDSYLSIIAAPVIWWGSGVLLAWYDRRTGAFSNAEARIGPPAPSLTGTARSGCEAIPDNLARRRA